MVDLLQEYVDGTLSAERLADVEAHFADCGDCGELAREYRELVALGGDLARRPERVPPDLADCAASFLAQRPAP